MLCCGQQFIGRWAMGDAEVETQLAIGVRLDFIESSAIEDVSSQLTRVSKMLYSLDGRLSS